MAENFLAPSTPSWEQMWPRPSKHFGHFDAGGGVGVKGCSWVPPTYQQRIVIRSDFYEEDDDMIVAFDVTGLRHCEQQKLVLQSLAVKKKQLKQNLNLESPVKFLLQLLNLVN